MDRLDVMKLYCRIVETGHLSLAADQLDLSKGTVSKQLTKLETYLGVRLLNRTTRRLAPTEVGYQYYERSKQILESVAEAECIVSGLTAEPQGLLRINAPMSFGSHHLGELLAQYQRKYPKVEVNITLSDRQVDVVEDGYDVVLRIAILQDSSLIVRRLSSVPIVMCASPGYLDRHGTPQFPEDLKNHVCLKYSYADSVKHWSLESREGEKKQIAVDGHLHANNGYLLSDAMVNGVGIALLPIFIAKTVLQQGKAQIILPQWQPPSPDLSILYPSRKYVSAKVRTFVDMSVEYFKDKFEI